MTNRWKANTITLQRKDGMPIQPPPDIVGMIGLDHYHRAEGYDFMESRHVRYCPNKWGRCSVMQSTLTVFINLRTTYVIIRITGPSLVMVTKDYAGTWRNTCSKTRGEIPHCSDERQHPLCAFTRGGTNGSQYLLLEQRPVSEDWCITIP